MAHHAQSRPPPQFLPDSLPVGTLAMKSGPLMASNDNFDVTILGQGAHAAMPEASHDPIVTLGELISNLQTIRSRNIAPDAALVLTIAAVQAGTTFNVIPNKAVNALAKAISRLNPNGRANKLDAIHIPKTPRTINVTIGIKIPLNMLILTMFRLAKI
ncbi:hypothetical protein WP50_17335 [Lactiplantibacillus plantarum]|nr:hypothetical protein WP50_17335 [Lactiplantibacillus plantarum]